MARKTFAVTIEGQYGDKRGTVTPRYKSKRKGKQKAEIITALYWFLKYARSKHWRVIRKRDGSYNVDDKAA